MSMGCPTHAAEVLVEQLHVAVDELQSDEFIVLPLNGAAEVEAGVPGGEAAGMGGLEPEPP